MAKSEPIEVEATVTTAEDPLNAGLFHAVPNAQVQIAGFPGILADASGHYRYDSIPQTASSKAIGAYDPVTRRSVTVGLPTMLIRGDIYFWGALMAGGLLVGVPAAVLFNVVIDRFIHGLTMAADS